MQRYILFNIENISKQALAPSITIKNYNQILGRLIRKDCENIL